MKSTVVPTAVKGDEVTTPVLRPENGTIAHPCALLASALRKSLMFPLTPEAYKQKVVLVVWVVAKLKPPTLDAPAAVLERVSS